MPFIRTLTLMHRQCKPESLLSCCPKAAGMAPKRASPAPAPFWTQEDDAPGQGAAAAARPQTAAMPPAQRVYPWSWSAT